MRTNKQILLQAYLRLARKAGAWLGFVAILLTSLSPLSVNAAGAQLTGRSATPLSMVAAASTTYTLKFTPAAANETVGSMRIEICDSPLESVPCINNATANTLSNAANLNGATVGSVTGWTGTWSKGGSGVAGNPGTFVQIAASTAQTLTASPQATVTLNSVVNPAGNNQNYYIRVTTYATTTYGTELDFGAMALQTAQALNVTASVQEQLEFCTGVTVAAGCASVGSASVPLSSGNASCPILSTGYTCTTTAKMAASTNANAGYTITYNGSGFAGPNETFPALTNASTITPGSAEQFGFYVGSAGGSGTATAPYATAGTYNYAIGAATQVASAGAATVETVYTMNFVGNVLATTKPGAYAATMTLVCVGNF